MDYIATKQGGGKLTSEENAQFRLIEKSKTFLTAEQERFLHYLWKVHQHLPARNLLVVKHLPFIGKVVRNFQGAPLSDIAPPSDATLEKWQRPLNLRHEMLAEAICGPDTKTDLTREVWNPRGFLRAIDTFDPDRGCRLSTHAYGNVLDALRKWNIRHRRCGEVVDEKRAPFTTYVLLSWPTGDSQTFGDVIADECGYSSQDRAIDDTAMAKIIAGTLDERERVIWEARHHGRRKPWLCEDEKPITFDALGKQLGISSQAVQQRAAIAEKKLRDAAAIKPDDRGPIEKPDWWVYKKPQDRKPTLYGRRRKYPCWVYTPTERAAFVASRPDLRQPDELRLAA